MCPETKISQTKGERCVVMGDNTKQGSYEIKTNFDVQFMELPIRKKCIFTSKEDCKRRIFGYKLQRSKSLDVIVQRNVKRGPLIVGRNTKAEEKGRMMTKRTQMLDKRSKLLRQKRQISGGSSFQNSNESTSKVDIQSNGYTSENVYLPLIYPTSSMDDKSKSHNNKKNSINLNEILENVYYPFNDDELKIVRQNSGVRGIIKRFEDLKLPIEEDDLRMLNRMNYFQFNDGKD
uniref:Uncharacterized protein n=1 Tax=Strongyloides venezuelensis TaxID=75913 RepID=A0A0K0EW27_STRVS